jgi:GPI-anchor transamidase subunit GAA1
MTEATEASKGVSNLEALSTTKENETDPSRTDRPSSKLKRILRVLLYLPYFLGITWTCIHPVVSVLTGEMKCRGWYIDEHSIEVKFVSSAWQTPTHLKVPLPVAPQRQSSLCKGTLKEIRNLQCHEHGNYFSMVTVTPLPGALDPVEEAVVFIVPAPPSGDWTTSTFHHTMLVSLKHLANPVKTPWLAKTLILVAPSGDFGLEETTSAFLTAYMGDSDIGRQQQGSIPLLPPGLSGAVLRTLVVLQVDDRSTKGVIANKRGKVNEVTNFAILPHGRRGVLPNMDLVFLVGKMFVGSVFLSNINKVPQSTFLVHDYVNSTRAVAKFLREHDKELTSVGPKTKIWIQQLADMLLFAYSMAQGPYPPHAQALDRGIDSITIKATFEGTYSRDPAVELVQYFEYMVRSLANLNERLHHSFTLYLLPSPSTFVSHMEYFLPNILILLPLAIRGFGLVLADMKHHLDLSLIGANLLLTLSSVVFSSPALEFVGRDDPFMSNAWFVCLYVAVLVISKGYITSRCAKSPETRQRSIDTLQFVACVLAAYILVPITFAHTSLSYVPSLLFTPLLSFMRYSQLPTWAGVVGLMMMMVVTVTVPPILLVPRVFAFYTPFVKYAYLPIHLQLLLLACSLLV